MRSSASTIVASLREAVALALVHVVLDGAAGGAHRVDEQLRLGGRHDLVVGALEHEHRHRDRRAAWVTGERVAVPVGVLGQRADEPVEVARLEPVRRRREVEEVGDAEQAHRRRARRPVRARRRAAR